MIHSYFGKSPEVAQHSDFKKTHPFSERKAECDRIREKYPDRVPVIVHCAKGLKIDKQKYLVPHNLTVSQFVYVLRKRMTLQPEEAMFLFADKTLPPAQMLMSQLYADHKESCGFIFVTLQKESTFG